MFSLSECEKSANRCKSMQIVFCSSFWFAVCHIRFLDQFALDLRSQRSNQPPGGPVPCTTADARGTEVWLCFVPLGSVDSNRKKQFNECRQRFRSMLVCKVLARIQDHLQNAEQALYRLRANSIVQICAVCIFTISIHLLILLAFSGIRWKATCYYSSRDERGEDKCD